MWLKTDSMAQRLTLVVTSPGTDIEIGRVAGLEAAKGAMTLERVGRERSRVR
jgi:hypothetical protein